MRELAVLAIALMALGLTGWLIGRLRPPAKPMRAAAGRYRGVAICPGRGACAGARRRWHVRYLARDMPPLPLRGCDAPCCRCRYIHYLDRRTQERRAAPSLRALFGAERRRGQRRCRFPH